MENLKTETLIEQLRKEFEIEITFLVNYLEAHNRLNETAMTAIELMNISFQKKLNELKLK